MVDHTTPDHTTPHPRQESVVWFLGVVRNNSRLKPGRASAKIFLSAWVEGKALKDVDEILREKAPADRYKKIVITE